MGLAPWIRIRIEIKAGSGSGSALKQCVPPNCKKISPPRFVFCRVGCGCPSSCGSWRTPWARPPAPCSRPAPPGWRSCSRQPAHHPLPPDVDTRLLSIINYKIATFHEIISVSRKYFLLKYSFKNYIFFFIAIFHFSKTLNTSMSFQEELWIQITIRNADPNPGAKKWTKN